MPPHPFCVLIINYVIKYLLITTTHSMLILTPHVYTLGGCPFGQDEIWNITWPATNASTIARQKCPGSSEAEG